MRQTSPPHPRRLEGLAGSALANGQRADGLGRGSGSARVRPISVLRFWMFEGLTQAES